MKTILLAGAISLIVSLLGTRPTISVLRKRKLGQQVRADGPQHQGKAGTPTMGGIVIIIASLIGYAAGHWFTGDPMSASGVLVLFLNLGALYYGIARWVFLRDAGRKLRHVDEQLRTDDSLHEELRPHLVSTRR